MPESPDPEKVAQSARDIIRAYKSIFTTTTGRVVLEDLQRAYCWQKPTADQGISLEEVYRRECMKHPLYHIQRMLDYDLGPDAKAKKPQQATSGSPT